MEPTYKIIEVISNAPEKFTAKVSFNGKTEILHEVDFDHLGREAVSLSQQRDELSKKCIAQSVEFNSISDLVEEEADQEKKEKLNALKIEALAKANSLMEEVNAVEAEMAGHASKSENRAAYIHEQLMKTAEMDALLIEQPEPIELSSDGKVVF